MLGVGRLLLILPDGRVGPTNRIDFQVAVPYPKSNAKTASIRLRNRFGGNRQLSAAVLDSETGQLKNGDSTSGGT